VLALVLGLEPREQRRPAPAVELLVGNLDLELEVLAVVAQRRPPHHFRVDRAYARLELFDRLCPQLTLGGGEAFERDAARARRERARAVHARGRNPDSERRAEAGVGWDEDGVHVEAIGYRTGLERTGAAERH